MTDEHRIDDLIAALSKPFPDNAIEQRAGGGGKMLSYVATETVIRRLNAVAQTWDFRITDKLVVGTLLVIWGELTIPGLGTRAGTGVQTIPDRPGSEDMWKGAASDCLKKCASTFGVGIDLYGPDLEAGELPNQPKLPARAATTSVNTIPDDPYPVDGDAGFRGNAGGPAGNGTAQPATPRQLKFIQALAREQGRSDDEINDESLNRYGKVIAQLDRRDASAFIERLTTKNTVTELPA